MTCQLVFSINTCIILIGDVIQANMPSSSSKTIRGCQVRDWIVWRNDILECHILYSTCMNES